MRKASKDSRMIRVIQQQLEAHAADRALVMDCKPLQGGALGNCGLYLYERDARAVVSSSVRSFTTPVRDPARWSSRLVRTFETGLLARERIHDERLVSQFFARNSLSEEKEQTTYAVGLDAGVTLVGTSALPQIPRAAVSFGRVYGGHLLSAFGTYAQAARSSLLGRVNYRALGGGLELDLRAEALESLTWELGVRAGWERAAISQGESKAKFDALSLGVRPGLMISVSKFVKMGPGVAWTHRTTLAEEGAAAGLAGKGLRGAAFEPSMRFEVSL